MDSAELDSANASLTWLDENSFNAECLPLESMDFAIFSGDVVPRDGIQRPVLVGSDGPVPRAPRASREKPVHVTHVHQTIIQATMPVATAHVATAAEGTSGLTCLERALSVPPGSIYKPVSKWRHRNKGQMGGGVPPHAQDGTLAYGMMLPPHVVAQVEGDVPPQPDLMEILATPIPACLPSEPLACMPVHVPHQVLEAIARAKGQGQVSTPALMPTHHTTTLTTCAGGPVAEAIARMAAEKTAVHERDRLAAQAERDRCIATARVLQRAGRADQAAAVIQSAPPHQPPPSHMGGALSLTPQGVISCAPPTLASPHEPLAVTWQGSLVAASSLLPPPPGTSLTPVQVAVEGVSFLPPGERRAKVASLAAAARMVAHMTLAQVNTLLGRPQVLASSGDAVAYVTASAIHTIGFGWAAGTIDGARRTWIRLSAFAQRTNAMAGLVDYYFHGYIVARYLAAVDAEARAAYCKKYPDRPRRVGDAKGSSARNGQAAACLFLARNLTFPIQVDCKAVTLVTKASRRRTTRQAPALGPRLIYILSWLTEHGDSHHVRCHAAGWLAMAHFALRLINAQRSCIISVAGDVVRRSFDLDAKISAGERNGRPM